MKTNIICNAIVENTSGKILVCKKENGNYFLPSCLEVSDYTLRESISIAVLKSSVTDIPDDSYSIFNMYEYIETDKLNIIITYYGKTKKVRFSEEKLKEGYGFISLSKLKTLINSFEFSYDKEVLRRYVIRGTSLINNYD